MWGAECSRWKIMKQNLNVSLPRYMLFLFNNYELHKEVHYE